ncbi:CBO0543 family protein [Bacillus sp. 1P10SD]|uniref:CBO0543 family protein n=1 Tax=Bacillus sp. 1P10SD TaxID=3132265 RepID=UPI0039A4DC64
MFGLVVVEYGLLTYPIRLFADVNRSSFTYEFYVYPAVCAIFNVFYPYARSKLIQFLYYCAYCTVLTVPEIFLEKYTELIPLPKLGLVLDMDYAVSHLCHDTMVLCVVFQGD